MPSIFCYQYLNWVLMYKVCVKYTGNITIEVNETLQVQVANNAFHKRLLLIDALVNICIEAILLMKII